MIKGLVVGAILGVVGTIVGAILGVASTILLGVASTILLSAGVVEWFVGYEQTCLVDKGYFPLIDGPGDFSIYVTWPEKTDEYISIGLTVPTGSTDTFQITEASDGVDKRIVVGSREAAKSLKARTGDYVRLKLESGQKIRASLWGKGQSGNQSGKIRVIRHGLIENPVKRPQLDCNFGS